MSLSNLVHYINTTGVICNNQESSGRIELYSPEKIDIYSSQHRPQTLAFIRAISLLIQVHRQKIHINFEPLLGMTAAGAVMVFAEITAMQLQTDDQNIITFTQPLNKNAKAVFSDFEFYKAIRPGASKKVNNLLKDDCMFQSGTEPVKHAISAILSLARAGLHVMKPEAMIFQASILEAMSNVRHHSYSQEVVSCDKRWWQFAFFDKHNSSLHFVVYDRGMGIPESMKTISPPTYNEGQRIQHAMTLGVTSKVDEPGRGKGSREILKTYMSHDNSSLLIYSGKGIYYQDKETNTLEVGEESHSIRGTILEWQIPYTAG